MDRMINKEGPIENTVEVSIYYQGHRERTEIDVIGRQTWSVISEMLWLVHHNPEINWRTVEVRMTRCLEECGRQWRPKKGKSEWQKQKEEEKKEEAGKKREEKVEKQKRRQKREKAIEIKRIVEE